MMEALLISAVIGVFVGLALEHAAKKFNVEKDEKYSLVLDALPGINCGACGYSGCGGLTEALLSGSAKPSDCPVSTNEGRDIVANILGVSNVATEKIVPSLLCGGSREYAVSTGEYNGPSNCSVMAFTADAGKACKYGCLGGGSCTYVCPVGAINMSEELGLPVIDAEKCISCELCLKECPKKLLVMRPTTRSYFVSCASTDKAPDVRKVCRRGCIGCKMCQKVCPSQAITVDNFLSIIDPAKCNLCGECEKKCPTKTINNLISA